MDRWIAPPLVGPLDAAAPRALRGGRLRVSAVGLGTGPLGNLYAPVDDADAEATVRAAVASGISHFDTAPLYGAGLAEERLGRVLSELLRHPYVLSTKAGFLLRPRLDDEPDATAETALFKRPADKRAVLDFSEAGLRRSLDESVDRLGGRRVDILYLHEPERAPDWALSQAVPALMRMRDEGLVSAVGAGSSDVALLAEIVQKTDIDVVLLSGGWTLLEQSAGATLMPLAVAGGVSVVLGSVFHGGLLLDVERRFRYPWAAPLMPRLEALREVAHRYGVSLPAAAIRFGLAHPAVASVLIGARTAGELAADLAGLDTEFPPPFWHDLLAAGIVDAGAAAAVRENL